MIVGTESAQEPIIAYKQNKNLDDLMGTKKIVDE